MKSVQSITEKYRSRIKSITYDDLTHRFFIEINDKTFTLGKDLVWKDRAGWCHITFPDDFPDELVLSAHEMLYNYIFLGRYVE